MILKYQEGLTFLFYPPPPIYRGKEGGGCCPARPGELGCFHQKAPPSFGTLRKAQVILVAICTPLFTKYTPSWCFFYFFLKRCGTLRITQRCLFFLPECCETSWITQRCLFLTSGMSRNFTDCATMLSFDFRHVLELHGLCNNAFF